MQKSSVAAVAVTAVGSSFRYSLDPTSKKFRCPGCRKLRLVRYKNVATGEYLDEKYGRCDREVNCGYWEKPEAEPREALTPRHTPVPVKKVFIPQDIYKASRKGFENNSFVTYLLTLFDQDTVTELITRYGIGTSKYFQSASVFWFIDQFGNIVAGQVKTFDRTGHTVKDEDGEPLTTWVHSILRGEQWAKEYSAQEKKITCLFGEHLLRSNPGKPVALVEAPKTAIIATPYFPKYLWMATGSLSYLTKDRVKVLEGRKVVLFPDLNAFERWQEKGSEFGFTTSDILEKNATEQQRRQGLDLADFLSKIRLEEFLKPKDLKPTIKKEFDLAGEEVDPVLGYPVTWRQRQKSAIERMIEINPLVLELIKRLDMDVTL